MITGETEYLLDDNYDDFFGSKKKRRARRAKRKARKAKRKSKRVVRRSAPKRIARRAKSKQFFSKLGTTVQGLGGATAIGAAIDTITNPSGYGGATETPSDFDFSMGAPDIPEEEKKGIPTIVFVLGGVVVVGVIGLVVIKNKKNKQLYGQ